MNFNALLKYLYEIYCESIRSIIPKRCSKCFYVIEQYSSFCNLCIKDTSIFLNRMVCKNCNHKYSFCLCVYPKLILCINSEESRCIDSSKFNNLINEIISIKYRKYNLSIVFKKHLSNINCLITKHYNSIVCIVLNLVI